MIISIKVTPVAKQNKIFYDSKTGQIKLQITAAPIEGKANKAVIKFLSKYFKIPKTSIEIKSGQNNKYKKILFKVESSQLRNFLKATKSEENNEN